MASDIQLLKDISDVRLRIAADTCKAGPPPESTSHRKASLIIMISMKMLEGALMNSILIGVPGGVLRPAILILRTRSWDFGVP
ncbi:hypothetical protein EW146_g10003 [Bondarzewia mesenterica]|uniref:Uncharacterized protein n=1 Tax=Bondarzewia mesenterica TaxID=1095465 RepID=A0A4S4L658_9AGAM|nr:hypothetical protein EW146_g10003 [Bondarzewia mesenterica]